MTNALRTEFRSARLGLRGTPRDLTTLQSAGIRTAGAGANLDDAATRAVMEAAGGGRVLVFRAALTTSGVPREWGAGDDRPGASQLPEAPTGLPPAGHAAYRDGSPSGRPGDLEDVAFLDTPAPPEPRVRRGRALVGRVA